MNYSQYSNKDVAASATWPDPLWATGNQSYTSVPQSTHPDLISTPGYLSTAGPCVGSSTWTDPAVPQNVLDPWSMPTLCMFLFFASATILRIHRIRIQSSRLQCPHYRDGGACKSADTGRLHKSSKWSIYWNVDMDLPYRATERT
jgi:hypothetical protein